MSFEIFSQAIRDSDRKVRYAASRYLLVHPASIGKCDRDQVFQDALDSFEKEKRADALDILKLLDDDRAVPAIAARLQSASYIGNEEKDMIVFMGDHVHGDLMLSLLNKPSVAGNTREARYEALVKTYNDNVIDALIRSVDIQRASHKDSAGLFVESMTSGGGAKEELLDRFWAAVTLGRIGGERAFELLLAGINPRTKCHKVVKRGCALGLAYAKDARSVDPLLVAMKESFDAVFIVFSRFALVCIGEASVEPIIRECRKGLSDENLFFVDALVNIESALARAFIQELKSSSDKKVSQYVLKAESQARQAQLAPNLSAAAVA